MQYLLHVFKGVNIIFAIAAVVTGTQALINPRGFAKAFGLALSEHRPDETTAAQSYVSLMGVRQLGTGIVLLTFAYQGKWTEAATVLSIIGILVAGTDGLYLLRGPGGRGAAMFHAVPGALIAALATAVIFAPT